MGTFNDENASYGMDQEQVADVLNTGTGRELAMTIGLTAQEIKAGATTLEYRKSLTLHNNSLFTMYWGYTNGVTVSSGTPIYANQFFAWDVGDGQKVYVIAAVAGLNGRATEA
jgi:hypothetical protein